MITLPFISAVLALGTSLAWAPTSPACMVQSASVAEVSNDECTVVEDYGFFCTVRCGLSLEFTFCPQEIRVLSGKLAV